MVVSHRADVYVVIWFVAFLCDRSSFDTGTNVWLREGEGMKWWLRFGEGTQWCGADWCDLGLSIFSVGTVSLRAPCRHPEPVLTLSET